MLAILQRLPCELLLFGTWVPDFSSGVNATLWKRSVIICWKSISIIMTLIIELCL